MINALSLRSAHSAVVDQLREENASALLQMVGIASFAMLTVLGGQLEFRIYLWEVPITLQTAAVYASGLYLGARNGLLAQLLYLTLGLFLPVFAGDGHGVDYFLGAVTAGYLVSYPLAAAAVGVLSNRWKSLSGSALSMLAGRRSCSCWGSRGCTLPRGTKPGWSRSTRASSGLPSSTS